MTTNTLAKLAADERTELLDWVSACQSAHLIDSMFGHRFGGLPSSLDDNRELLVVHVESILAERVRALTAQALPAAGRCDECGKDQAEGWALYCVDCLEKTGLLAKEALPNAQHVSSTADLTASNDTAARAITGAPTDHTINFETDSYSVAKNEWTERVTPEHLTDHEIETLAHRMCWRYKHSSDPAHSDTYTFNRVTLQEFARKLMQGETE